jgi:2,4-dienoyl-CoA reductase-like NADH-dependent reductase (Old Yellow Enzyme family)
MNDLEKLRVLLPHWVEHNAEHASEFRTWAERAKAAGEDQLAAQIVSAAEKMEAANYDLEQAIAYMDKATSTASEVSDT